MVKYHPWDLEIGKLTGQWNRGEIKSDPEWQRSYIWKLKDEQLLVDSIIKGIPIPKIYLTQDWDLEKKSNVYSVIDGQQRLTAIYKFLTNQFPIECDKKDYYFKDLDQNTQKLITSYQVTGNSLTDYSMADIILLFERLNRTGIKLTNMENWHSKYNGTNIWIMLVNIYDEHKKYYPEIIYTEDNCRRFLHLDDILDMCNTIYHDKVSPGGSKDLEDFLKDKKDIADTEATKIKTAFRKVVLNLKEILPKEQIAQTPFVKRAHFVSLFIATLFTIKDNYILKESGKLQYSLEKFINNQPKAYKETLAGGMRQKDRRGKRVELLKNVLIEFAEKLDNNRFFSNDTKMKLWSYPDGHKCKLCGKIINSFGDATVDHIVPWAKGGSTIESNGQIAHKLCNKKKSDAEGKYIIATNIFEN